MEKLTKRDIDHLNWLYHRMIEVHKEDKKVDYMMRFREIISKLKTFEVDLNYDHLE